MAMIQVNNTTRRYGTLTAVDDVSFEVNRNEIVGFVGPNGAGKSTMLKMLSTFLLPNEGSIKIDGIDAKQNPLEIRRRIGYLSGDTPLYEEMRVDSFLRFIGQARNLHGDILKEGFDRVIELCGLQDVVYQRVNECSTGFRQRIGLATALIHDPPILLLDEPTHGFDPMQVLAFRDMLRSLRTDRAILFSTHIIADVEAISDRVLIIHQGKILGDGSVNELAKQNGIPESGLEQIFAHLIKNHALSHKL
ncbi:MAG: ATP-binding cassette domain-containing protein [Candidatus Latescibacterota bacterium]|nr:ATP-binding cassette domain-containing protein [Candidatus Latescibacterota bacterium]